MSESKPTGILDRPEALPSRKRRRLLITFLRNRTAIAGLALAVLLAAISLAAPFMGLPDPYDQSTAERLLPPSSAHPLGRDTYGRDSLSRVVHAGRVSLLVGIGSVLIGGILGTVMGIVAGYLGGRIETLLMRLIDVLMAFPSLLLGLMVLSVLGAGLSMEILAIGIVIAPAFARVVHGQTLIVRQQSYVEAARSVGARSTRILAKHILPNLMGEIVVLASIWIGTAIRVEANLSFIGLGVPPPTPTWGNMIREGTLHLSNAPWVSVFPGLAILLAVMAFNLLGDGLRDVFDPRMSE